MNVLAYHDAMKIAVVGGGIAGLSAAYLLAPHADVTLYESGNRLGGHAHTARVDFGGVTISVDTGFMVFNPARYPYFISLLRELSIPTVNTVMSFSVSIPGVVEYSSDIGGLFGNPRQLMQPAYWRLLVDILRFNRDAKQYLTRGESSQSLGEFLDAGSYSPWLAESYLFPMLGSIWSAPIRKLRDYSALETFRFLDNHLLLNALNKPIWKTVSGGSVEYVSALSQLIEREGVQVKVAAPVVKISRSSEGVHIRTENGDALFDKVVIATHANTALSLLSDPTEEERTALSGFSYTDNVVVLHSDPSFMPHSRSAWASWNYHTARETNETISLTYHMNALQNISSDYPLFVTLNPRTPPRPELLHGTYAYAHPVFDRSARESQQRIAALQGSHSTVYAGAHLGYGFHEDGVVSAVEAVKKLGVPVRLRP